jgi:transcriptional regulator with XRE-family HTH domain
VKRFPENLALVLKMLSLSSAGLASRLETDKSVISRWLRGDVRPSAHNLGKLSALVATSIQGFTTLDWDRPPESLAAMFGYDAKSLADGPGEGGPPLAVWKQLLGTSRARGSAYVGIFRCTRPHPMAAGRFLIEHALIQSDPVGVLHMTMGSPETRVGGWLMPLQGLVYSIASDPTTGTMLFAIFNGVGASRVDVLDGLILIPGADMGRAPTATAMMCERVADLTGDGEADLAAFETLCRTNPLAPVGAISERLQSHLTGDFGPGQLASGGEWLLNMSLKRSLARGPDYDVSAISGSPPKLQIVSNDH